MLNYIKPYGFYIP